MGNRRSSGIAAMTEPGWAAPERAGTLRTSMPPHAALHDRPIRQLDVEGELHGPDHVVPLSLMRGKNFAKDYGVFIEDGPLAGITARAVVVLDDHDRVVYRHLLPPLPQDPHYHKALPAAQ